MKNSEIIDNFIDNHCEGFQTIAESREAERTMFAVLRPWYHNNDPLSEYVLELAVETAKDCIVLSRLS